jgi:hypothetical protein
MTIDSTRLDSRAKRSRAKCFARHNPEREVKVLFSRARARILMIKNRGKKIRLSPT